VAVVAEARPTCETAVWVPDKIGYTETCAFPHPAFVRPAVRAATVLALGRATARPVPVLRALAHGAGVKEVAAALLFRETARAFQVSGLQDPNGRTAAVSVLLPGRGASPVRRDRPAVTGVLIAQNEAARIGRALDSLQPFVDELRVLDGGSTDDTVDVARAHGAEVAHRRFDWDFAAQRNALLEQVKTPWVCWLDCDESLEPELGQLVSGLLGIAPVDAIVVPRLTLVGDDPQPALWPDVQPRLHRSSLRFSKPVHERLAFRTAVYTPLTGPFVLHDKPLLTHLRNSLRYSELDPKQLPPEALDWVKREVARLEAEGGGEPAVP
jgi:hypothetical protein